MSKLTAGHFKRETIPGTIGHMYVHRLPNGGQICFESCYEGYCVGIYDHHENLIGEKRCTRVANRINTVGDIAFFTALEIANEMVEAMKIDINPVEKDPLESPFVKTKVVHTRTTSDKIVDEGVDGFILYLKAGHEMGEDMVKEGANTLPAYIAGYTKALMAMGINVYDATRLGEQLTRKIFARGGIDIDKLKL